MVVIKVILKIYVVYFYYGIKVIGFWLDIVNSNYDNGKVIWNIKLVLKNIGKVDVYKGQWVSYDVIVVVKLWNFGGVNYGFKFYINGNGKEYWKKLIFLVNFVNKLYIEVMYIILKGNIFFIKVYYNGDFIGYFDISWKKVEGVKGYKVWIYNGKEY